MKKVLVVFIFLLFFSQFILVLADDSTATQPASNKNVPSIDEASKQVSQIFTSNNSGTNAWNETVIISPVWQQIFGTLFGLNLSNESAAISVNEAIVFFMLFIMIAIILFDVVKLIPFFDEGNFSVILTIAITLIISITGGLIALKSFMIAGVHWVIDWPKLHWLTTLFLGNKTLGVWLTVLLLILTLPLLILMHMALNWLRIKFKKMSKISLAKAKGRKLAETIKEVKQVEKQD